MHDKIGRRGRDIITNFSGIIIGRLEYISGCSQLLLSGRAKDDGTLGDGHWIDEQRVEIDMEKAKVVLDNGSTPGADKAPPARA